MTTTQIEEYTAFAATHEELTISWASCGIAYDREDGPLTFPYPPLTFWAWDKAAYEADVQTLTNAKNRAEAWASSSFPDSPGTQRPNYPDYKGIEPGGEQGYFLLLPDNSWRFTPDRVVNWVDYIVSTKVSE